MYVSNGQYVFMLKLEQKHLGITNFKKLNIFSKITDFFKKFQKNYKLIRYIMWKNKK